MNYLIANPLENYKTETWESWPLILNENSLKDALCTLKSMKEVFDMPEARLYVEVTTYEDSKEESDSRGSKTLKEPTEIRN
jgi:hypothetical protein